MVKRTGFAMQIYLYEQSGNVGGGVLLVGNQDLQSIPLPKCKTKQVL
ncbi:MAG: hypothetical protein KAG19_04530 [Methylococcales bacterium]|nr:hypothetical protein [Methylococcales bacterium]